MAYEPPGSDRRLGELLPKLVLASQSPARRRLLEEHGCNVLVSPTYCDESHEGSEIQSVVEFLSIRKLEAYLVSHPGQSLPILAADTLIWCAGAVIGKAQTRTEAFSQLRTFSGITHEVHSGFALSFPDACRGSSLLLKGNDRALVAFNVLSDSEIDTYLDTEEWIGAAGSYRIQGLGRYLISRIDGDFSTVVGLPINRISAILEGLALDF